MVESRIRHLISKLETVEILNLAHPFVKGFDKVYYCASEQEANDILESRTVREKNSNVSTPNGTDINIAIHTTTFYIGLQIIPREGLKLFI